VKSLLFKDLHIEECQLDELWSFVKKKKNLTPLDKILTYYGDAWVWLGFDPVSRMLPAFVVGKKNKANAYKLIEKICRVTDVCISFFSSDELVYYKHALLRVYGIPEDIAKGPRKRGDLDNLNSGPLQSLDMPR